MAALIADGLSLLAEAGFFPGAILFLSLWVPARHRAKILSLFYLAQPLTTVIGAPLAGALISADGIFGLEGWRFMFFGVGVPAIGILAQVPQRGRGRLPQRRLRLGERAGA